MTEVFLLIKVTHSNNDGTQLYVIFEPIYKTITTFFGLKCTISEWESQGLSNEKSRPPYTANKSLSPKLARMNNFRTRSKFKGNSLKQEDQVAYIPICCKCFYYFRVRFIVTRLRH